MKRAILLLAAGVCVAPTLKGSAHTPPTPNESAYVDAVDAVGMTVGDMDRAVAFYTEVLSFEKRSDVDRALPPQFCIQAEKLHMLR